MVGGWMDGWIGEGGKGGRRLVGEGKGRKEAGGEGGSGRETEDYGEWK